MIWDIDPVLIQFDWLSSPITDGPLQIRFYGLFFAVGLLTGAWAYPVYFEKWGFTRKQGERLTLWAPIGMIVGAHLIHLFFYETHIFTDFFSSPNALTWEHLWQRLVQIGSGLASHGGGLGAIVVIIFFARHHKRHPLEFMDPAMCGAAFVIPWVRVGNFFNSEIVGRAWDSPYAIYFPRHECPGLAMVDSGQAQELCQTVVYRHPSQVYEAVIAFLLLGLSVYLMAKWRHRLRKGAILFILLGIYFATRFGLEYFKAYQIESFREYQALGDAFPFTMGQLLSAPIVLLCLYMLFVSKTSNILKPLTAEEAARVPAPGTLALAGGDPTDADIAGDDDPEPAKKTSTKRKKRRRKKK